MGAAVNTKRISGRRDVELSSLEDLQREIDAIVSADRDGSLRALGNWSAGQNLQHIGRFFEFALDGFPFEVSRSLRLLGRLMRNRALNARPPAGLRFPANARALAPDDNVPTEEGAAYLRAQLDRIGAGERMTAPSPLLGPLEHDEWVRLQLNHAELHLSFLDPGSNRPSDIGLRVPPSTATG